MHALPTTAVPLQMDLKAEAQAMGQQYLADPSYQEATQMSFADLFKKVGWGSLALDAYAAYAMATCCRQHSFAGIVAK